MVDEGQIYDRARAYAEGQADIAALEDWLVSRLGILLSLPRDSGPSRLAGYIELSLSELSDGVLTEREFREGLQALLRESPIEIFIGPLVVSSSANVATPSFAPIVQDYPMTLGYTEPATACGS
jgi:hypothetical protein